MRRPRHFVASCGLKWCRGMFSRAQISKKMVPKRSETCLTLNQGHESYSAPELSKIAWGADRRGLDSI